MSHTDPQWSLQDHVFPLTTFVNLSGKSLEAWDVTLPELGQMILDENRIRKNLLPLLKMGLFGLLRTEKKSLRHDANLQCISGVEMDHDSGRMRFTEAVERLRAANVRCIVATSPSHLIPDEDGVVKEKWRVLAPASKLLPVTDRWQLAARLNGVLDGAAARELFTPVSQTYYYGRVNHNPAHQVEVLDGEFVDLRVDLDEGAVGEPVTEVSKRGRRAAANARAPEETRLLKLEEIDQLLEECIPGRDQPDAGHEWRPRMLSITWNLARHGLTADQIREKCGPFCISGEDDEELDEFIRSAFRKQEEEINVSPEFVALLGKVLEDAQAAGIAVPPQEPQVRTAKVKPVIYFGDLAAMVDEAAQALIKAGVEFYQRGGKLVRPVVLEVRSFGDTPAFSAQLIEVDAHYLRDMLARQVQFLKFNATAKKWLNVNPPMEVALTLLAKFGDWEFRVLAGIITTQTLRPDGSVLAAPGYDAATQLLLLNPPDMPEIPALPTREDARAALKLLKDLLAEFPFAKEEENVARAVALSAQISTVCRGAYPVMPMHVVDAPAAGTGKSYLLSTVSWIATGEAMPATSAGKTPEELGKRLAAAALTGQALICIDNVEDELGGDTLCHMIEQTKLMIRPLGVSDMVGVDTRAMCIFADGNNITLVGDVYRRAIICRLDAGIDRPEKRQFTRDPKAEILANRGAYVAACLTIARAYLAAGRPGRCPQIASFNAWSDCVRSALVWLGETDPVNTMDNTRGEDPHVIAHHTLMVEWHSVFANQSVLLRDVVTRCGETAMRDDVTGAMRFAYADLRSAVQATNPEAHRRDINANMLGQKMKQYRGQWVGGMCFVNKKTHGENLWMVEGKKENTVSEQKTHENKKQKV